MSNKKNIIIDITQKQAYQLLKIVKQDISKNTKATIYLDPTAETGSGAIQKIHTFNPIIPYSDKINIGYAGIKPNNRFQRVNTHDFINCIITGYHEQRHHQQIHGQFKNQKPTEKEQLTALNSMICENNRNYYLMNGNYYTQLCEIDAEQHGLKNAYLFLKNHLNGYSDQECQQLIVDYTNQRVQDNPYHIPQKEYKSLLEIINAFNQSFQKAVETPKPYYTSNYQLNTDVAMEYMYRHDDTSYRQLGHRFLHDTYLSYQTGVECEKMIGCITKLQIPTCTNTYICLKDMDLSPKTILGVSLNKDPREPWTPTQSESHARSDRASELESLYGDKFERQQIEPEDTYDFL